MNKSKLNPFAFPAETQVRFAILILLAVSLAWAIGNAFTPFVMARLHLPSTADCQNFEGLIADSQNLIGREILNLSSLRFNQVALQNRLTCFLPALWIDSALSLGIPLLFVLLMSSIAGRRYITYPNRLRRKKQLKPITLSAQSLHVANIQNTLRSLTNRIGLFPPPIIEYSPHDKFDAQVFGRHQQYILHMLGDIGRISKFERQRRKEFEAVLLHELAHIVNRDMTLFYMASELWGVLLPFFIFQYVISTVISPWNVVQFFRLGSLGLQIIVTYLIITLTARGLVRVREFYADWRADSWGAGDALKHRFSSKSKESVDEPFHEPQPRHPEGSWLNYLVLPKNIISKYIVGSWHPSYSERKNALEEVKAIFQFPADLPLLVGISLGAIMTVFFYILTHLAIFVWTSTEMISLFLVALVLEDTPLLASQFWAYGELLWRGITIITVLLTIFFVALFVAAAIGFQMQRDTISRLANKDLSLEDYIQLWKSAGFLSVGTLIGFFITPFSQLIPRTVLTTLALFPWFLFTVVLTWLWLAIVRFLAKYLLESHIGPTQPRAKQYLHVLLSALFLLALYIPIYGGQITLVRQGLYGLVLPNTFYLLIFIVVTFMGLGISFLGLGLFYFCIKLWRYIFAPVCPICDAFVNNSNVVGQLCLNGHQLSSWLFVQKEKLDEA